MLTGCWQWTTANNQVVAFISAAVLHITWFWHLVSGQQSSECIHFHYYQEKRPEIVLTKVKRARGCIERIVPGIY